MAATMPLVTPKECVRNEIRRPKNSNKLSSANNRYSGTFGVSKSIDSANAACILCGSNNPTGVATCGMIPLAVNPTKTNLPSTSISYKSVCGVSTQLIHFFPRLSVGMGGIPFTLIISIPFSFVLI